MSQKGCSVSLNEERALQASHFCISPRHVAALPGYALVMCYSPWEGLREVVVTFVPLSLAVSPSVSVCRLKRSAWLSQDVSFSLEVQTPRCYADHASGLGLRGASTQEVHTTPSTS